jgi:hypothetical protein
MKLEKAYYVTCVLRRIIGYLQKLLYTVNRIQMSPTPTLNIYLFEGPIYFSVQCHFQRQPNQQISPMEFF